MANTETVSIVLHAGTTPDEDSEPRDGFNPTILFNAAGTRPEPAVSVPKENETIQWQTETAEPLEEPPGTISGSTAFKGAP